MPLPLPAAGRLARAMLLVALQAALALCLPLRASAQDHQPDLEIETAPVEVDGQVLFRVRGASSLPADARAARVSNRIEAAAADPTIRPEELFIRDVDGIAWIMARDQRLVGVIDADARLEQLTRAELAEAHLSRIRAAISDYREARQPEAIRRDLRDAIGATAVFVAAVVVLILLARWLRRRLSRWVQGRVESTGMSSLDIVRGERIAGMIQQTFRVLASLVLIVILFEYPRASPFSGSLLRAACRPACSRCSSGRSRRWATSWWRRSPTWRFWPCCSS